MLLFKAQHQGSKEGITLATRVILVRHGISSYNLQRRVQGHCDDSSLAEQGQQDAAQVGLALKGLTFDVAYSSPLKRAQETAQIILKTWGQGNLPLGGWHLTDDLKEINLSQWEGLTFDEVESNFPDGYALWRDRPHDLVLEASTPDGFKPYYPVRDLFEQAQRFWQDIVPKHEGKTLLVVAHSGINRALLGAACGFGVEHYKTFEQTNCGISVLNFGDGLNAPAQLESVNLTTHLGKPLPSPRTKGGLRLLLVRHGETDWNRQKKFQGQIDVPLNAQGKVQSQKAGEFLKSVIIDRAVTSPMLRPKETAELILAQHPAPVPLELEDNLKEISHGLWEGKLEEEIALVYADVLEQWKRSPEVVQMPEGENLQQVWERSITAWKSILTSTPVHSDKTTTVMVVAHDAVNKAILCHLMDWEPDKFWVFKQGNGSVTVIDYPNGAEGRPAIRSLNITSHLSGSVLDQTAAGAL